jgi:hypothetical protein
LILRSEIEIEISLGRKVLRKDIIDLGLIIPVSWELFYQFHRTCFAVYHKFWIEISYEIALILEYGDR